MNKMDSYAQLKIYEIKGCLIDLQLREVTKDFHVIKPEHDAFQTLIFLIENRDHRVSMDEFRKVLWRDREVSEFEITRAILLARKAICDEQTRDTIVYDPHSNSYQLVGDVLELEID